MKDVILGQHLLFARTGDSIDGITVGAESKPDGDPEANYTRVASCEGWQPRRTGTRVTRRAPDPGAYVDRASFLLNKQMEYAFNLQEWSDLTLAECLLGGEKPVGGVFVPNASNEDVTGWWLMRGYDQVMTRWLGRVRFHQLQESRLATVTAVFLTYNFTSLAYVFFVLNVRDGLHLLGRLTTLAKGFVS